MKTLAFLLLLSSTALAQGPLPESDQPPGAEATTPKKLGEQYPEDALNRVMPWGLQVLLHGYFRAPLRLAFAAPTGMMGGSTNIRSPWLVDDDYFRSGFAYTRLQEQDWSELYLGVGNKYLSGEIALMGSLYSDWAKPLIDRQWGIAQGFVTLKYGWDGPRVRFKLKVRGGAFWDKFGWLDKYDTYLFGRTHQMGVQVRGDWTTQNFGVWLLDGVGAHLEDVQANQGLTLLNYFSAGLRYKRLVEVGFYFLDNLEQDKRQLSQVTDADLRIYGLEGKVDTLRFGRFYLGGSIANARSVKFLSPSVELIHSYGGTGLTDNFLGDQSSDNGTGRLYNIAFKHRYSIADLLRVAGKERLHKLRGGDVTLELFGLITYTLSPQVDMVDRTNNKNGRWYLKWGAEAGWSARSWLAISLRYDRVILDMGDNENAFRVLTPKISLRTHWLVDAEIFLAWSHYWYGQRVRLRAGQVPLETMPDSDVLKLQAQIAF